MVGIASYRFPSSPQNSPSCWFNMLKGNMAIASQDPTTNLPSSPIAPARTSLALACSPSLVAVAALPRPRPRSRLPLRPPYPRPAATTPFTWTSRLRRGCRRPPHRKPPPCPVPHDVRALRSNRCVFSSSSSRSSSCWFEWRENWCLDSFVK
jgi:hypothetical protein